MAGTLEKGIINWGHTDVLSGKALSYFITNKIVEIESFKEWTKSASKWKKRSEMEIRSATKFRLKIYSKR